MEEKEGQNIYVQTTSETKQEQDNFCFVFAKAFFKRSRDALAPVSGLEQSHCAYPP